MIPEAIGALSGTLFGAFVCNCFTGALHDAGKDVIRKVGRSLLEKARDGTLPANHDLARALRRSLGNAARVLAWNIHDPERHPLGELIKDMEPAAVVGRLLEIVNRNNVVAGTPEEIWLADLIAQSKSEENFADFDLNLLLQDNDVTGLLDEKLNQRLREHVQREFLTWCGRHLTQGTEPQDFKRHVQQGWPIAVNSQRTISFYEVFCLFFREELKTNEKAYRIYTATTLAELKADIAKMSADALTAQDRPRLEKLAHSLEDFAGFKKNLDAQNTALLSLLHEEFAKLHGRFDTVDTKLNRIAEKLDQRGAPQDSDTETKEDTPADITALFDEVKKLADAGHYPDAKAKCEEILKHSQAKAYPLSRIKAKKHIAAILSIDDPDSARPLFQECLDELRGTPSARLQEDVLARLGNMETQAGNLLEAKAFLTEA